MEWTPGALAELRALLGDDGVLDSEAARMIRTGETEDHKEAARAFVDRVMVSPRQEPDDPPTIELVGHLAEMLRAGGAVLTVTPLSTGLATVAGQALFTLWASYPSRTGLAPIP